MCVQENSLWAGGASSGEDSDEEAHFAAANAVREAAQAASMFSAAAERKRKADEAVSMAAARVAKHTSAARKKRNVQQEWEQMQQQEDAAEAAAEKAHARNVAERQAQVQADADRQRAAAAAERTARRQLQRRDYEARLAALEQAEPRSPAAQDQPITVPQAHSLPVQQVAAASNAAANVETEVTVETTALAQPREESIQQDIEHAAVLRPAAPAAATAPDTLAAGAHDSPPVARAAPADCLAAPAPDAGTQLNAKAAERAYSAADLPPRGPLHEGAKASAGLEIAASPSSVAAAAPTIESPAGPATPAPPLPPPPAQPQAADPAHVTCSATAFLAGHATAPAHEVSVRQLQAGPQLQPRPLPQPQPLPQPAAGRTSPAGEGALPAAREPKDQRSRVPSTQPDSGKIVARLRAPDPRPQQPCQSPQQLPAKPEATDPPEEAAPLPGARRGSPQAMPGGRAARPAPSDPPLRRATPPDVMAPSSSAPLWLQPASVHHEEATSQLRSHTNRDSASQRQIPHEGRSSIDIDTEQIGISDGDDNGIDQQPDSSNTDSGVEQATAGDGPLAVRKGKRLRKISVRLRKLDDEVLVLSPLSGCRVCSNSIYLMGPKICKICSAVVVKPLLACNGTSWFNFVR